MTASIILALRFPDETAWGNTSEVDINSPSQSGFACDAVEAQKLYPFDNGLIKISTDRVSYLDLKGSEVFGEVISMESPFCTMSGKYALVGDTNGVQYLTMNSGSVIYKANAKGTIDYGSINKDGYAALIMDEAGVKGVTQILKPDGSAVFTWKSAESGYILSAQINPESALVDVLLVNTDSANVKPMMKRFGINGEAKGQFIPKINELLPILLYDKDNDPVSCGASSLICFDGTNEKYRMSFSKIYHVTPSDYGILLTAKKESGDIPALYRISADGTLSEGIPLSESTTGIAVNGSKAAVGSGNVVVCVSLDKMKETSRKTVSASTIRVGFSSASGQVIVVARDGVSTFNP